MLRYLTAGESHGQALVVIIEGLPAGLQITVEDIQLELSRAPFLSNTDKSKRVHQALHEAVQLL